MNRTIAAAALMATACQAADSGASRAVDRVDGTTLRLGAPLATTEAGATTLEADLELGGIDGFGHVADVAALGDGRFAVLDRMNFRFTIFDADGSAVRSVGRAGSGPGEFRDPLAIAVVGGNVVVWDGSMDRAFTVFDTTGRFRAMARAGIRGDWRAAITRSSFGLVEHGYQEPAEDRSRRLFAFGDGGFVHVLQQDEEAAFLAGAPLALDSLQMFLVRYDLDGDVRDTVAVLRAPPSLEMGRFEGKPYYDQPLLVGRPLWASGDGWWATGHGDSTAIVVRDTTGAPFLRIELADRPRALTKAERIRFADWAWELANRYSRDRSWLEQIGRAGYRKEALRRFTFAASPPIVTGLFGAGDCLWIAGFDVGDQVMGESRTLTGIDVRTGTLVGVVRIPRPEARIRDVDRRAVYTTVRDSLGVFHVQRWRFRPVAG